MILLAGCSALRVDFGTEPEPTRMHLEPDQVELETLVAVPRVVELLLVHDGGPATELGVEVHGEAAGLWQVEAPASLAVGSEALVRATLVADRVGALDATLLVVGGEAEATARLFAWAALDDDGDGYGGEATGGDDCDDADPDVHPGAADPWYDGVDSDCRGDDDYDADGDGVPVDEDCDDRDPDRLGGSTESWNGLDDDCDGAPDDVGSDALEPWLAGNAADQGIGGPDGMLLGSVGGNPVTWLIVPGEGSLVGVAGPPSDLDLDDAATQSLAAAGAQVPIFLSPGTGDVDDDGVPEMLVGTQKSGTTLATLWLFDATPQAEATDFEAASRARYVASQFSEQLWTGDLGDLDGDGLDDVVGGAPLEDAWWVGDDDDEEEEGEEGEAVGAVTAWLSPIDQSSYILRSNADYYAHGQDEGDALGYRVRTADVDGDGYDDVLAGQPGADGGGAEAGAVLVLAGGEEWREVAEDEAELVIEGVSFGDQLGAVTLPAPRDLDGDGQPDLVLPRPALGEVAVFADLAGWSGTVSFADASARWARAGATGPACVGEVGGGELLLFFGAPEEGDAGAVWVLGFDGASLSLRASIGGEADAGFGSGCASGPDVDDDGVDDVFWGAVRGDERAADGGVVYRVPAWI